MLVEDEPRIGCALAEALREAGFEVELVDTGREAIRFLSEQHRIFSVLLTDIRLSDDVDGWAVGKHARLTTPGIAVIYMTGDSVAGWLKNGVPGSKLLSKPFEFRSLLSAMTDCLSD